MVHPDLPIHPINASSDSPAATGAAKTAAGQLSMSLESGSSQRSAVDEARSLQELIEQCTGLAPSSQNLRLVGIDRPVRLDLNCDTHVDEGATLRGANICHGDTIQMSETSLDVHRYMSMQALQNRTDNAWIMPKWEYSKKPGLLAQGGLPAGGSLSAQNVFVHNSGYVPPNLHIWSPARDFRDVDPCATIRARSTFQSPRRR